MKSSYASSSVVITGAGRGIGRVIAKTFAARTDHPLILIARTLSELERTGDLCEEAGAKQVEVIGCDLAREMAVKEMILPDHLLPPGIIINNAGSFLLQPLQETSNEAFNKQLQANLMTAVHTVQRFLGDLKNLDRGLIINICSAGSLEGLAESGAYASSKHALLGYTRSLRKELMQTEVAVTAVNLGQTQSTSWKKSDIDAEKLIAPKDVADLLVAISKMSPRSVAEEIILKPLHGRVPPM